MLGAIAVMSAGPRASAPTHASEVPATQQAFGKESSLSEMAFASDYPVPIPMDITQWYRPLPANASGCTVLIQVHHLLDVNSTKGQL